MHICRNFYNFTLCKNSCRQVRLYFRINQANILSSSNSFDLYFYNELFDLSERYEVREYIKYFAKTMHVFKQNLQQDTKDDKFVSQATIEIL